MAGMMDQKAIPEDVKRFILISIRSIPHLEALLLLRSEIQREWDAQTLARRLYTNQALAQEILADLAEAGFLSTEQVALYRYNPAAEELRQMTDRLAETYSKNLIAITELIHEKGKVKAQQFADAFILRKD